MNAKTNAIIDIPWAAWPFGETRPMTMNTIVNTTPYRRHSPSAARPSVTVPPSRNPNRNPNAAVTTIDHVLVVTSASARPITIDSRGTGSDSSLPVNPLVRSSATATAMPAPVNSTIVAT